MEFFVLGPVEAWHGGMQVPLGRRRAERCLLGLLLLEAGHPISVDRLVDLLWEDDPPRAARNTIQGHVSRLRSVLDPSRDGRRGVRLVTYGDGYAIRLDAGDVDAQRFKSLAVEAKQLAEPSRRVEVLRRALALWRGPVLADVATDRMRDRVGTSLMELRLQSWESCFEAELEAGRHREVITELFDHVEKNPARERLVHSLMLALYRDGRQADALQVYRETRDRVADSTGLDPGAQLRGLHDAILRDDPGLGFRQPAQENSVAPASRPIVPAQLPNAASGFTGRNAAIKRLDELADEVSSTAVIIAITGTAGVGKTALAVQWGHDNADRFPDGQLHFNLRGHGLDEAAQPLEVLTAFLRALGVAPHDVPGTLEEASSLYRTLAAHKRLLILLDNASSAQQVRPLLPGRSGSVVLVTSRHRLAGLVARDGARRLGLEVLSAHEATELLSHILGPEQVHRSADAGAVLVELCGYLPLALRIAAATLADKADLSMEQYVAELRGDDRLAKLAIADDEQSVVRSAFDHSNGKLDPAARRMFRLLGLLPFLDFTAHAAAAIAEVSWADARALLDRLSSAHLIEEVADGRFIFHDLLRVYARERAQAQESQADIATALRRFFEWFLSHVNAAAQLLRPGLTRAPVIVLAPARFRDSASAMRWMEAEHANLVATVRHCAEHGPFDLAWMLADSSRGYFSMRRHLVDWASVATDGMKAADRAGDATGRAAAGAMLAQLHYSRSEYQQALDVYQQALVHSRQARWLAGEVTANSNLAIVQRELGRLDLAEGHIEQSLLLLERSSDRPEQARALVRMGTIRREQGRIPEAVEILERAIALQVEVGLADALGHAEDLNSLGFALLTAGRLHAAADRLHQALALARRLAAKACESSVLDNLANVDLCLANYSSALEQANLAMRLAIEIDNERNQADLHHTLGRIEQSLHNTADAMDHMARARQLAEKVRLRTTMINALVGQSSLEACPDSAMTHAKQACELAERTGHKVLHARSLAACAGAGLRGRHLDVVRNYAEQALAIQRAAGARFDEAQTLVVLAEAYIGRERSVRLDQAAKIFAECGVPEAHIEGMISAPMAVTTD